MGGPLRLADTLAQDYAVLRVAHALGLVGGLALIVYSDAVDARSVWEPVAFAAVTVLLLFVVLLFRYRRQRGRRYY